MSGEFTEHADIRYTTKELLAEIRAELRAMNVKLELKADRETAQRLASDIAALKLEQERRRSIIEEFRREQVRNDHQDEALQALEGWRNRVVGALALVILGVPLVTGVIVYALQRVG